MLEGRARYFLQNANCADVNGELKGARNENWRGDPRRAVAHSTRCGHPAEDV